MKVEFELMMKCDMCYDRTSAGKRPMCATVCPSGTLYFGKRETIERDRPRSTPLNRFRFGKQTITTKVQMMVPRDNRPEHLDVAAAMNDVPVGRIPLQGMTDALFEEEIS